MYNQKGFAMVEVLISIVIIAIGLLGVAAMQTGAMTGNLSANDVVYATQLAEEMIDRIRANSGDTPDIYNSIDTNSTCGGSDPSLGDCTQWQTRVQASGLRNARGQVTVTTNSPLNKSATITVTVTWGIITRTVTFTTVMETFIT